jgi:hypothetical protein
MRSAQAAGLHTEGANQPLLFHAQAEIIVAPLLYLGTGILVLSV